MNTASTYGIVISSQSCFLHEKLLRCESLRDLLPVFLSVWGGAVLGSDKLQYQSKGDDKATCHWAHITRRVKRWREKAPMLWFGLFQSWNVLCGAVGRGVLFISWPINSKTNSEVLLISDLSKTDDPAFRNNGFINKVCKHLVTVNLSRFPKWPYYSSDSHTL